MPSPYGIDLNKLEPKKFRKLISLGSSPAYYCYMNRLNQVRNSDPGRFRIKKNEIDKYLETLKEDGIKFNLIMGYEKVSVVTQLFINVPSLVENMPMRALMNHFNNYALNKKLHTFYQSVTIKNKKYHINNNSLKSDSERFTTADINKIRFSLLLLNFFSSNEAKRTHKLLKPKAVLSRKGIDIYRNHGFPGLLKLAKPGTKRVLKQGFAKMDDDKISNMSFFKSMSVDLAKLLAGNNFKNSEIKALKQSYEAFSVNETPKKVSDYPISYIFHPRFMKDNFKGFEKLNRIGLFRIKDLEFLNSNIFKYSLDIKFIEALHKSYSDSV